MRIFITIITLLLLTGCSSAVVVPGDEASPSVPIVRDASNSWIWGTYRCLVSADHQSLQLIPARTSSLHLNMNPFVEGEQCPNCLSIGKPQLQPDGTIKLKVWLRHPYPNLPVYTGFDVRGIVVFKATDYMWTYNYCIASGPSAAWMIDISPNLNYSDQDKGGTTLLNPDGYTFYLNPLITYIQEPYQQDPPPILNYSKGEFAYGEPDCTVNPYILFSDGSQRRMFKVNDFMVRTYHIKPPEGEFEFGYVVSACWAQPTTQPVTNPETDFPVEANCEDPINITVEQLQPMSYDVANEPLFKVTINHRPNDQFWYAGILVPTISSSVNFPPDMNLIRWHSEFGDVIIVDEVTTEITLRVKQLGLSLMGELVAGHHLGMVQVLLVGNAPGGGDGPYPTQLISPIGVHPVDVYVEV